MYDLSTEESASWAFAAELAPYLPPSMTLGEEHPMDGFYDLLVFRDRDSDPMRETWLQPRVELNRPGSAWVMSATSGEHTRAVDNPWPRLADRRISLTSMRRQVLRTLDTRGPNSADLVATDLDAALDLGPRLAAYRAIAAALSLATAARMHWECRWGVAHGGSGLEVVASRFAPYGAALAHVDQRWGEPESEAARWWFITNLDIAEPVLAVSTSGQLIKFGAPRICDLSASSPREHRRLAVTMAKSAIIAAQNL